MRLGTKVSSLFRYKEIIFWKGGITMKCLQKYHWVKLPRKSLPQGKGIMGAWMKLASRAAFCKGMASYCGHNNPVEPGMWAGGVLG